MAEYIEREALYEKAYWHGERPDIFNPYADGVEAVDIVDVDSVPAADVAPVVRGRWIPDGNTVCCSECKTLGSPQWKGCPVCLARMDGE